MTKAKSNKKTAQLRADTTGPEYRHQSLPTLDGTKRHPKKYRKQCAALESYLKDLFELRPDCAAHVWAFENTGFRIAEVSLVSAKSGESYQRSTASAFGLGLILACEDFVRMFHVKPYRPEGWTEDLDEFDDAKWVLATLVKDAL